MTTRGADPLDADDGVLKGFGIFADEDGKEFADAVEEAGERMGRDFGKRADRLFADRRNEE